MFNNLPSAPPQVRTRCRNTRCGAALKIPTDDRRAAFCCSTCERAHYGTRCIVCETAISKKSKRKAVCPRSKCRQQRIFRNSPARDQGERPALTTPADNDRNGKN